MNDRGGGPVRTALSALVGVHLIIAFIHGVAHDHARVPLTPAARLFVLVVILAAPAAGAALVWWRERAGAQLVAIAMAGSFLFGVVNHFVLAGPDHVAAVAPEWRLLFSATAALLALTEAAAVALAMTVAGERTAVS